MRSTARALSFCLCLAACGGGADAVGPTSSGGQQQPTSPVVPVVPTGPTAPTYDIDGRGIPRFAGESHIDLAPISRISMFRSGFGHDYSDASERCRSMKHYFQPRSDADWSKIGIYAPVTGSIATVRAEQTFGTQIVIRSAAQPAFTFILFHVNPAIAVDTGTEVVAGQQLGWHVGTQTLSDIAVGVDTPGGYRLISWFDVMTDELFARYQARGIASRATMVISRAARDASPLTCDGETFVGPGSLENWVTLN